MTPNSHWFNLINVCFWFMQSTMWMALPVRRRFTKSFRDWNTFQPVALPGGLQSFMGSSVFTQQTKEREHGVSLGRLYGPNLKAASITSAPILIACVIWPH